MNTYQKILFRTLVQPFYNENKGILIVVFTMMFFIVSQQSGAGLYAYHYSLVTGMLTNHYFLLFVFFSWFLYARKCMAFVADALAKPGYQFFQIFNNFSTAKRVGLFAFVQLFLMMPINLYSIFILFTGWHQQLYGPLLAVIIYLLLLCIAPAVWYPALLGHDKKVKVVWQKGSISFATRIPAYEIILARFVINEQKITWAGIQLFTCGVLYLVARNNLPADYDLSIAFIFFNLGILCNGIIIFRMREFEKMHLLFYRGLPVSLVKRLLAYSIFYIVYLIPVCITVLMLTPDRLHYTDAFNYTLCAFSSLLLMGSVTYRWNLSRKDYVAILLLIFFAEYIFLVSLGIILLYLLFFILATVFFLKGYYQSE